MITHYRIGLVAGVFDMLHPGHVTMLAECRKSCESLIVALQTDPTLDRSSKHRPVQTTYERYTQLAACRHVSTIIPYDTEKDLENMLGILDYDVRFVGIEYFHQEITGISVMLARGKEVVYTNRDHDYSSSDFRKRIRNEERSV